MSALFFCIIPCFAGDRKFSWLAALHTRKLVTGNDLWHCTAGQSRPTMHSLDLHLQQREFPHTSILPHSAIDRGSVLPGHTSQMGWDHQVLSPGHSGSHRQGQEETQTPSSWQGQAADTRNGAGRVPQSLNLLVPRLP